MARLYAMSWEGKPNYRWVKMHKGVRHRVTCDELGAARTKEGSYRQANAWWAATLAELNGPSPAAQVLEPVEQVPLARMSEVVQRGEAMRRILTELPFAKAEVAPEVVERIIGVPVEDDALRVEMLGEVVARATGVLKADADRTLKHHAERFLDYVRGEVKPLSYREIRDFIRSLYDAPEGAKTGGKHADHGVRGEMGVDELTEAAVERFYFWLRGSDYSSGTKKKRWGFFKRLVRYCWAARLIELPRNLDLYEFTVTATKVKTYTVQEVRAVLKKLKPRLRLYALLGLNCGMTSADMGQLRKDQVDLDRARLVRKRVKTADHDNVPEVDYPLWPETVALLREHRSTDAVLFLTSEDDTPLWESRLEDDGETPTKDLIYQQFKRAKAGITVKAFRSISATMIESHELYGRYKSHFLGHSPKSLADKNYAAPSGELFDRIMSWLHGHLFKAEMGEGGTARG